MGGSASCIDSCYYIQPFVQSIVVLPLYPQDARSSTGNALDAATAAMQALG